MNEQERKARIRPIRRSEPNLRRLARAFIELAATQNERTTPKKKRAA